MAGELSFEMYQRPHSATQVRWWLKDHRGVSRLATLEEIEMYQLLLAMEKVKQERKKTAQ